MAAIFDGLKVIDCGSFIAAPVSTTLLADYGAEVIKLEPPGLGDTYRGVPDLPGMPRADDNYCWLLASRGKLGLSLDLAQPEGQAVLDRLIADADVFVTNYPLAVRGRLAIDADRLRALNPRLIYASFTGYGESGPERAKPGFDVTAYWARSGLMDIVRSEAEATPARAVAGLGDHPSAVALYAAIVTALYQRERTGQGMVVSSSLLANGLWSNGVMAQAALCGARFTPRPPRERLGSALSAYYRCGDGRWLVLAVPNEARDWPIVARALGLDALIEDPRFRVQADRFARSAELIALFDEVFAQAPLADWRRRLDAAGVLFERVAEVGDHASDEQLLSTGVLRQVEGEATLTIAAPFKIEGAPAATPRRGPTIGQHNQSVLEAAGYSAAEIAGLRARGVI